MFSSLKECHVNSEYTKKQQIFIKAHVLYSVLCSVNTDLTFGPDLSLHGVPNTNMHSSIDCLLKPISILAFTVYSSAPWHMNDNLRERGNLP
jgi:hypothetical protein